MESPIPEIDFPITKRVVALDLETTSTNPAEARIVEISIFRFEPGGRRQEYHSYVNPECQIPQEATAVHGITNERVKESPVFARIATHILEVIGQPDFIGYNVLYDLQVLTAEFARLNLQFGWKDTRILDGYRMWQAIEPRTLTDAVNKFLGGVHVGAHGALADNIAAFRVALALLHDPLFNCDLDAAHKACFPKIANALDATGKLLMKDGQIVINFGKNAGKKLSQVEPGYLEWMLKTDFPPDVKAPIRDFLAQRR